MAIGDIAVRVKRQSTAVQLAIDPENPYGIVGGIYRGYATRWITRGMTCMAIDSMSDGHLINSINMLERKCDEHAQATADAFGFAGSCRGDAASYYAGHMADDAADRSAAYSMMVRPMLEGLRRVARARGLAEVLVPHHSDYTTRVP